MDSNDGELIFASVVSCNEWKIFKEFPEQIKMTGYFFLDVRFFGTVIEISKNRIQMMHTKMRKNIGPKDLDN